MHPRITEVVVARWNSECIFSLSHSGLLSSGSSAFRWAGAALLSLTLTLHIYRATSASRWVTDAALLPLLYVAGLYSLTLSSGDSSAGSCDVNIRRLSRISWYQDDIPNSDDESIIKSSFI